MTCIQLTERLTLCHRNEAERGACPAVGVIADPTEGSRLYARLDKLQSRIVQKRPTAMIFTSTEHNPTRPSHKTVATMSLSSLLTGADGEILTFEELTSPDQLAALQDPSESDALAAFYKAHQVKTKDVRYLDSAISCGRNTLKIADPDHVAFKKWQWRLSNHLASRYSRTQVREDLDDAITHSEASLLVKHIDGRGKNEKKTKKQGQGLDSDNGRDIDEDEEEEEEEDQDQDQEEDEESQWAGVSIHGNLLPSHRSKALHILGQQYRMRYENEGQDTDFSKAQQHFDAMDKLIHKEDMQDKYFSCLRAKTFLHMAKFEKTKALKDLEQAADVAGDAQDCMYPNDDDERDAAHTTLGDIYDKMYDLTQDKEDLNAAIYNYEESYKYKGKIKLYNVDKLCRLYLKLALVEYNRFHGREASSHACTLMECVQPNSPQYEKYKALQSECFTKLADSDHLGLLWYYVPTNAAIRDQQRKIKTACNSLDNKTILPELYSELAKLHRDRFMTQNGDDFKELHSAVEAIDNAIQLTPLDDAKTLTEGYQYGGMLYGVMHQETESPKYASKAVEYSRNAYDASKESDLVSPGFKALVAADLGGAIYSKLDEDCWDDVPFDNDLAQLGSHAYDFAVKTITENCTGDDDCGYCNDHKLYSEEHEQYKAAVVRFKEEKQRYQQRKQERLNKEAKQKQDKEDKYGEV